MVAALWEDLPKGEANGEETEPGEEGLRWAPGTTISTAAPKDPLDFSLM